MSCDCDHVRIDDRSEAANCSDEYDTADVLYIVYSFLFDVCRYWAEIGLILKSTALTDMSSELTRLHYAEVFRSRNLTALAKLVFLLWSG